MGSLILIAFCVHAAQVNVNAARLRGLVAAPETTGQEARGDHQVASANETVALAPLAAGPAVPKEVPGGGPGLAPGARCVYVDLGCNWGNTLRYFHDIGGQPQHGWEVYAFEASPLIAPYADKFSAYLDGAGPKPALTVPPAGSTLHLQEYATRYGCPQEPQQAMRECMWGVFRVPLQKLQPEPGLMTWPKINERLARAKHGTAPSFTFVPAAAGAHDGTLTLSQVTAEQMIRGGAHSVPGAHSVNVPMVDLPKWLHESFTPEDYVVVKMDIEGGEFAILNALLAQSPIVDKIALECHGFAGNCVDLEARARQSGMTVLEHRGRLYDSFSSPDTYVPVHP